MDLHGEDLLQRFQNRSLGDTIYRVGRDIPRKIDKNDRTRTIGVSMHKGTLRYGLVGFGAIARNRIAREGFALDANRFKPLAGVKLAGVCDVNPALRPAADTFGLAWYDSYESMLEDKTIDAVFIATNNATHFPLLSRAVECGKHGIVEKPMATTLAQGEEIRRLSRASGRKLAVDHMMVHNAYNRAAQALIAGGAIGEVNDARLHMEFQLGKNPQEAACWRCARPQELGGPIGDVASHCLYMAEFLLDALVTEVAGATGAGDASIVAFLVGLLRGLGPEGSLKYANCAGCMNLAGPDALSALGSWEEMSARIGCSKVRDVLLLRDVGWVFDGAVAVWKRCISVVSSGKDRKAG